MILFYLSLPINILTVREEFWKENEWNQSSSILFCKNGSHLRLADDTLPRTQAWERIHFSHHACWDPSSHWSYITPNRSDLYVSRRYIGETQQRTYRAIF